jgi:hypothetical protein
VATTVEAIEAWLGRRLPEPYLAFLAATPTHYLAANGLTLVYGRDCIVERNDTYESRKYCPGHLMVGDDSGGLAFVLSLDDGSVHSVDMGAMTPNCLHAIAPDFAAWIDAGFPCLDD